MVAKRHSDGSDYAESGMHGLRATYYGAYLP